MRRSLLKHEASEKSGIAAVRHRWLLPYYKSMSRRLPPLAARTVFGALSREIPNPGVAHNKVMVIDDATGHHRQLQFHEGRGGAQRGEHAGHPGLGAGRQVRRQLAGPRGAFGSIRGPPRGREPCREAYAETDGSVASPSRLRGTQYAGSVASATRSAASSPLVSGSRTPGETRENWRPVRAPASGRGYARRCPRADAPPRDARWFASSGRRR